MYGVKEELPLIHLWIYNHPLVGITDQVDFFFLIMRQHGYTVTMGRRPRLDALNVVIENFSESSSGTLIDFCEQTGKRVALIMTEHLDLRGDELYIHGERLWNTNDYMHPVTQVARIKNLMDCVPYIRNIFILGDLPRLEGSDRLFPGLSVRFLPFPKLHPVDLMAHQPSRDFVFTGFMTNFREQVVKSISKKYSLTHTTQFLSRRRRDQLNHDARIVLNIPQRPDWEWLSLMRILAALRSGRATVSIRTNDTSCISRCCFQLNDAEWQDRMGELLGDWRGSYNFAYDMYELMRIDFLKDFKFPSDIFEVWAMLERESVTMGE